MKVGRKRLPQKLKKIHIGATVNRETLPKILAIMKAYKYPSKAKAIEVAIKFLYDTMKVNKSNYFEG